MKVGINSAMIAGTMLSLSMAPHAQAQANSSPQGRDAEASGDIIVTARRVEERLQDVPISITVLSQQDLTNRNIFNAGDLGTYVPSLSTNSRFGPEKSTFAIRGFNQEGNPAASVGVYFADVVAPRSNGGTASGNGAGVGSFFDLQNVQVLKGPQGTLFGRNTTGGAILLVPQKPTDTLSGYLEGSIGDYDMRRVQAVLNVPLSDTFRIRGGVDWNKRDGYLRNRSGIGPDRLADTDYIAARLSIVGDLTPNLENYLIASFSESRGKGGLPRLTICDRNLAATPAGFLASLACSQIDRQNARGDGFWDVENSNSHPYLRIRQWQVINTTTWRASDALTIKNIASYAQFRESTSFSLSGENFLVPGTTIPFFQYIELNPGFSGDNSAQETFTEELQFQGTHADGRLNWQAGAYLEISNPLGFSSGLTPAFLNCTDYRSFTCTTPLGPGAISSSNAKYTNRSKGLYAQASYKLTDQLTLTGGIRYTNDRLENVAENVTYAVLAPGIVLPFCQDRLTFNGGNLFIPKIVAGQSECRVVRNKNSSSPTWLVGVDFKPTDDVLLYAKYARGYRQGGINPNNLGLESWNPEKVDTYEAGVKTSFRGSVIGYFNVAGFYNQFRDQQVGVTALVKPEFAGAVFDSQLLVNAGKSRMWGIEVDASISPFAGLKLDAGYAYLNTRLLSINVPPAPAVYKPLIPTALPGETLALSPKNRVTLTGTYTLPLSDDIGKVSFGATFTHTDANNALSPLATPLYRIKASDLLNLNASWNSVLGQPIDLSFFMTNVTNEKRIVFPNASYFQFGADGGVLNEPRMWGVRVRYRFGD